MWYFYATLAEKPVYIPGFRIVHFSPQLSLIPKHCIDFFQLMKLKRQQCVCVCVVCLPATRFVCEFTIRVERGVPLGGIKQLPLFLPSSPALHTWRTQTARRAVQYTCTTCLPQRCSQVTISQGQRLRGIVELRFECVPLANIVRTGTGMSAHSNAGRKKE